jgi:hypothetical protein
VDDTSGLDQFCTDAAQEVMRALPDSVLKEKASRTFTTTSAGVSVVGKRILSVSRGGYFALKVDEAMRQRVTNSASLFRATARSPVYYEQVTATDTRLYVKPDPAAGAEADIAYVAFPSIDASADSTATNVPTPVEDLVVLGAARRVLQKRLADYMAEDDLEHANAQQIEIERIESLYRDRLTALTAQPRIAEQGQPDPHLHRANA